MKDYVGIKEGVLPVEILVALNLKGFLKSSRILQSTYVGMSSLLKLKYFLCKLIFPKVNDQWRMQLLRYPPPPEEEIIPFRFYL